MKTKTCSNCNQNKSLDQFYKRTYSSGKIGTQHNCKACAAEVRARYYKPHSKIRYQLGLTVEQVEKIIAPQTCAACGAEGPKVRLCIDHCHTTNKVRGLLCHQCNTALGLLQDNIDRVRQLEEYLEQTKQQE